MAKQPMFCSSCGTIELPKVHTPGSFGVEVLGWLFFIVPGVLYSMWRLSARKQVCAGCGATTLLPPDSPVAVQMQRAMEVR